jgi:hypothetical protein
MMLRFAAAVNGYLALSDAGHRGRAANAGHGFMAAVLANATRLFPWQVA